MKATFELEVHSAREIKPYPAYRKSGVEWMENMPAHWVVRQLGNVGRFFKGGGGTKEDDREYGIPCIRYGDLYTRHRFFITESRACVAPDRAAAGYTPIRYGDVLFAGSGETIDEIGKSAVNLIHGAACCGGDIIVFRPSIDVDPRFLAYATDCRQAAYQKACMGRGITVMHIYGSELKYMTVALPPLPEQAAIVRYLDHVDQRIQRYIRSKQKLIALLEEKKQALIHEAVTGRIDVRTVRPYPAYKNSGVEWLGEVPEHWRVQSLGRIGRFFKGCGGTKEDEREDGVPCVRYGDLYTHHQFFIDASRACVTPELAATVYTPIRYGDVLFAGSGETVDEIGKSAVNLIRGSACCGGDVIVFRPSIRTNARFLGYATDCPASAHQKACIGRGFTVMHVYSNDLKYMAVALPPLSEQAAIVRFLDHAVRRIRRYIETAQRQIDLFGAYHTRLIADVVTGKIDVRVEARGLSDVAPLAAKDDSDDGFDQEGGSEGTGWRHGAEEDGPLADVSDTGRSHAAVAEPMTGGR